VTNETTILIVDDEELLRNALVFQFKREGFNVMSASNGKEAFEIIKNNKIDAVVSDVQMAGGNGIDLLKDVKNFDVEIPVLVFITAFADISDAEAYDLGADAIFSKPFDRKQLVKCIKDAVAFKGRAWKNGAEEKETQNNLSGHFAVSPGRGGAFVAIPEPMVEVGSVISFSIETELKGTEISLQGKALVRWVRTNAEKGPVGVGLEFMSLESSSLEAYEQWLKVNPVKAFIPLG
jgi:CheY-like chemotaxis protein